MWLNYFNIDLKVGTSRGSSNKNKVLESLLYKMMFKDDVFLNDEYIQLKHEHEDFSPLLKVHSKCKNVLISCSPKL